MERFEKLKGLRLIDYLERSIPSKRSFIQDLAELKQSIFSKENISPESLERNPWAFYMRNNERKDDYELARINLITGDIENLDEASTYASLHVLAVFDEDSWDKLYYRNRNPVTLRALQRLYRWHSSYGFSR